MSERIYEIIYAGHPVYYSFLNQATVYKFKNYIKTAQNIYQYDIKVTPEQIETGRPFLPSDSKDSYIEYRLLIQLTSRFLLRYNCCIFHSVSFVYQGYAWLLTAPSGTGKTTQYCNWKKTFPDEIIMISGDMPVLECREDEKIYVHPTSWNGKENIGNKISAPLGGIIYLEQGPDNKIDRLSVHDGLLSVYNQFIVIPETKEEISSLCKIIETMFKNYPVLKYLNSGDEYSTVLLRKSISSIMETKYAI